jgi:hypothetical protein
MQRALGLSTAAAGGSMIASALLLPPVAHFVILMLSVLGMVTAQMLFAYRIARQDRHTA